MKEEGWSKAAMGKMRKADSFLREVQRITGAAICMSIYAPHHISLSNGQYTTESSINGPYRAEGFHVLKWHVYSQRDIGLGAGDGDTS